MQGNNLSDNIATSLNSAPYRRVTMAQPKVNTTHLADGSMLVESDEPLGDYERQIGLWLRRWAKERPDQIFVGEREGSGHWRTITYAQARKSCDAISQALLNRGLNDKTPVMILSENSVNFALLALGAMQVGIPVAPISPSYSLASQDFSKLLRITGLLKPGLIYAEDGDQYHKAIAAINDTGCKIVMTRNPPNNFKVTDFQTLLGVIPTIEVENAFATVGPDHVAKYLFTSGSTGSPKGVINTQRMLCSNQQMVVQVLGFLALTPPIMVDWLPWHHTAAGNAIFNIVLSNGGTYYIDGGKPVEGRFDQTLANLREISPTVFFNVPTGFSTLLPYLENEKPLRDKFFKELQFIWYAGAALSQDIWDRLEQVAYEATGERIVITSGFGSTESTPCLTFAHWHGSGLGNMGIPLPGCEVKLAPVQDKLEIRAKGPSISPGYLGEADLTVASCDEDGFFKFGDAMRLLDHQDPSKGLIFDGRLSENFKLASGTWVNTGILRTQLVAACAPAVQDLVICGENQNYLALLAWPSISGCQQISPAHAQTDADLLALTKNLKIRTYINNALATFNRTAGGSSRIVRRVILMAEPAQIDAGEITDKGYINQPITQTRRADLVSKLYCDPPSAQVMEIK